MRLDVRRLAAVDMWGGRGTRRRRAIIVAEFVIGATVGTAVGLLVAVTGSALARAHGSPGPVSQLWIAVPLLFVALDLVQRRRRDG